MRHRSAREWFRAFGAFCAGAGVAVAAGCSSGGAVKITPPSPHDGAAERMCEALHRALPDRVDGMSRRDTSPSSRLTAAWGGHPVELRCGGGDPAVLSPGSASYDPTAEAVGVNGVDWVPEKSKSGVWFTTVERKVNVAVWVPRRYAPGYTDPLVDLASAVKRAVPSRL